MLKDLTVKLGADFTIFERALGSMQQGISKMQTSVQTFAARVDTSMKAAEKSFEEFAKKPQEAADSISGIGENINTYFALPMIAAAGASIKFASDMDESLNKVKVSFGNSAQTIIDWSETSIESMGMASGSALDAAALFGDMATSMGISQDEAAKMSMSLTQLGADLSSFKNVPLEQAMQALNGVFTGETESLKMLGVVMTQTQLEAFALSKGIKKNVQDMSEAEMVNLRYAFVLDKTKNAQGDYKRTAEGTANQMRQFTENLKELSASFGQILMPSFNSALQKMNEFLKSIEAMPKPMKEFMIGFSGVTIAIGALLFIGGRFISFIISMKEGLPVVIGFLSKFRAAIGLGGLAVAAFVSVSLGILAAVKYWDELTIGTGAFFKTIIPKMLLFRIEFEKMITDSIIKIADFSKSLLSMFGEFKVFDDIKNSMMDFNKELDRLAANESAYISAVEYKKQLDLLNVSFSKMTELTLPQLIAKQNENAGKTEFVTAKYAKMSYINELVKKSQDKVASGAKSISDAQQKLIDQSVKLADSIGNAIITALRNRQKAQDETIKKLEKNVQDSKDLYSDWLDEFKRFNEEYISNARSTSNKIIDEINNRYDEEDRLNNQRKKEMIDPYQDRADMLKGVLDEEAKLDEEALFEKNKMNIISANQAADRNKMVEELAKQAIATDMKLNEYGDSLKIKAIENLTDEENQLLRNKINEARKIRLEDAKINIQTLQQQFAMQQQIAEQNRLKEIAAEEQKLQTDLANFKSVQDQKLKLRTDNYNSTVSFLSSELEAIKQNYIDYSNEVTAQNAAKAELMKKDQTSLMELLKSWNPDWKAAGKSFGENLLEGIKSQSDNIKSAISSMMDLVNKANNLSTKIQTPSTTKIVAPKVKLAEGGIVTSPTIAMIGEGGQPEAVIPLSRLGDFTAQQETHIYLDGREITRRTAPLMVDQIRTKLGVAY